MWKPGDRALVLSNKQRDPLGVDGAEVTLIEYCGDVRSAKERALIKRAWKVHWSRRAVYVAEHCLHPLGDPNQKLETWDECPFKPEMVE